jgi:hypothetical protein
MGQPTKLKAQLWVPFPRPPLLYNLSALKCCPGVRQKWMDTSPRCHPFTWGLSGPGGTTSAGRGAGVHSWIHVQTVGWEAG